MEIYKIKTIKRNIISWESVDVKTLSPVQLRYIKSAGHFSLDENMHYIDIEHASIGVNGSIRDNFINLINKVKNRNKTIDNLWIN